MIGGEWPGLSSARGLASSAVDPLPDLPIVLGRGDSFHILWEYVGGNRQPKHKVIILGE
jgi:hypothetical protein